MVALPFEVSVASYMQVLIFSKLVVEFIPKNTLEPIASADFPIFIVSHR